MSAGEDALAMQLTAVRIPFEREFKFHPDRRWRADFFIKPNILVEVDGGVFVQGRHSGGMGQVNDMEKHNAAALLGYLVFRFEPGKHIKTGIALQILEEAYGKRERAGEL